MGSGTRKSKKEKNGGVVSASDAGLAFKHGFYLETVWILSQLFERKVKRVLKRIDNEQVTEGYSFEQCLKRIKYLHQSGRVPQLETFLDAGLIDGMRNWKNNRNAMLKDMITIHVTSGRMERLASEGISLYKTWSKSLKTVKKALDNPGDQTIAQFNDPFDED
ncbi:MAG: hypothetical protein WCO44_17690 [Bacteroidota bacterium]